MFYLANFINYIAQVTPIIKNEPEDALDASLPPVKQEEPAPDLSIPPAVPPAIKTRIVLENDHEVVEIMDSDEETDVQSHHNLLFSDGAVTEPDQMTDEEDVSTSLGSSTHSVLIILNH